MLLFAFVCGHTWTESGKAPLPAGGAKSEEKFQTRLGLMKCHPVYHSTILGIVPYPTASQRSLFSKFDASMIFANKGRNL